MMKWKARTETTNIGVLDLGNITFDEDFIEISIDIYDMSEELKAKVNKAIEDEKVRFSEEIRKEIENGGSRHPKKRNTVWSDKPVVIEYTYLSITLEAGKANVYNIEIGFHDSVDDYMETCTYITVDLSAHADELKKAIIKALIDRFF